MSATISQIAKKAGVTHTTVSRILSGKHEPKYRPAIERAARVRQIADRLGYRPNAAARATASGRFDAVALLIGSITPRYLPAELVYAVERDLIARDQHLIFTSLPDQKLRDEGYVPKVLQQLSVDGLLIHYTHQFPKQMRTLIETHRIPSIWINTKLPHNCVFLDDHAAAYQITQRLLALGHRRIAYVNFRQAGHYSEADRRSGYVDAMSESGCPPQVHEVQAWHGTGSAKVDDRLNAAHALLAGEQRPTAVVCYETSVAGPIVHAASLMGLQVPRDLSIIKFGRSMQNDTGMPISTLSTSLENVGCEAVRLLERKIDTPQINLPPRAVQLPLIGDATLAPPNTSFKSITIHRRSR